LLRPRESVQLDYEAELVAVIGRAGRRIGKPTSDLIFDVATLISLLSEACTLQPGDLLVTGTPAGVGFTRKPPVFMKSGDVCEAEVEGVGTLVNPVADDLA
jgi:2-keto-4-pentenoate hydratase/2-oxohepta-3-ene-1,7-dioic acid hydratase in catechol pathway